MSEGEGQNLRQMRESLSGEEIAALNAVSDGLGLKLHRLISTLGNIQAAQAGHAGPVLIAHQTKKDPQGKTPDAIRLQGGTIGDASPATKDDQYVTLAQIRQLLLCENLAKILSECVDFSDLLEERVPPTSVLASSSYFVGVSVWTNQENAAGVATVPAVAGNLNADLFFLPFDIPISKMTFMCGGGIGTFIGIGIYDSLGNLKIDSGAISTSNGGVQAIRAVTLPTPITLPRGLYYQGLTGVTSATCYTGGSQTTAILNGNGVIRYGKIVGGGSAVGVLPATFDPTLLVDRALQPNIPIVVYSTT